MRTYRPVRLRERQRPQPAPARARRRLRLLRHARHWPLGVPILRGCLEPLPASAERGELGDELGRPSRSLRPDRELAARMYAR